MRSRLPRSAFAWKLRVLYGSLANDSWGARAGKLFSLGATIAFAVGATFFFRSVFQRLVELEGIGEPLLWRIIGISLATVFILLVVSNLITGIATIYRSHEIPFMLSKPVPYRRVFRDRFTDNLVYSSWSLVVLGVPLVAAWGWVFGLPIYIIAAVVLFALAPLILISSTIAVALLMGFIFLAYYTSPRLTLLMVTVAVLGVVWWAIGQRDRGLIVEGRARSSTVERYLAGLQRETRSHFTPPQWMTVVMRAARNRDWVRGGFFAALLTLTAAVWMRWLVLLAGRIYYRSWVAFGDLFSRRKPTLGGRTARRFTAGGRNPLRALLLKDLLQFTRNPNQWAQFLILVSFLLIYLANLIWVSSRFNFDNPHWKILVLFLNFAFTGFILATLSVRFVFPLISLEGRSFWVVRSAPVSTRLLFWEKFFLAFAIFMWLCEVIVFVSNRVLHVSSAMMTLTTTGTFLMGATLTGMAIGMGALLPDFNDESPMRIASTPGGVVTVILSLLYVGLMVAALAYPTEGYFRYLLGRGDFPADRALKALTLVLGLSLVTLLVPLRLGGRAMKNRDL